MVIDVQIDSVFSVPSVFKKKGRAVARPLFTCYS
jgi:hypothetical protein